MTNQVPTPAHQAFREKRAELRELAEEIFSPDSEGQSLEDQRAYEIECAGKIIDLIDELHKETP